MKKLFLTLLTLLIISSVYSQVNYSPYMESINSTLFISSGDGGGVTTIKIEYNTITLSGSIGVDNGPSTLNTGQIAQLNAPYNIPNATLGYIINTGAGGGLTSYQVSVENNWIVVTSSANEAVSYVNFSSLSVDLTPNGPNDNTPTTSAPTKQENYIYELESKYGMTGDLSTYNSLNNTYTLREGVRQSISYFDGLGRGIQSIGIAHSPNGGDIIGHMEYDGMGRQAKDFLQYPSGQDDGSFIVPSQVLAERNQYYTQNFGDDLQNGVNPFSEKIFDGSPLGRVLEQGAPGSDWKADDSDHTIKFGYGLNTLDLADSGADNVHFFEVEFPLSYDTERTELAVKDYYKANELTKSTVKDENWQPGQQYPKDHTVQEFKDKTGRVVLKRAFSEDQPHDTYYVYDRYGNLSYVIPPKASDVIVTEVPGNDSGIIWEEFYPWVDLVEVDSEFAVEYHRKLSEYTDEEVRNTDIENEYGGQGGFSLIAYRDGTFSMDIDFSSNVPFELKQGIIATFDKSFSIKDAEIGVIEGSDYGYRFMITNNHVVFEGSGKISLIDQEFFTEAPTTTVEAIDQEIIPGLCYIYHYDRRNRLVEKKVPGKGWEHIVYNKNDQPVLTQDPLMRADGRWLYTKYDIFARPVYTGRLTYVPNGEDENSGRLELQAEADSPTALSYESFTSSPSTIEDVSVEYTDDSFPVTDLPMFSGVALYEVNYYDRYGFNYPGEIAYTGSYDQVLASSAQSLVTGSKVRVLETDHWITSVVYYDKKGRPIFTASKNEYLETVDITKSQVDFSGVVLQIESTHKKTGHADIVTVDYYTYDSQDRLLEHVQSINGSDNELIAGNTYDDLGSLTSKRVGGPIISIPGEAAGLQTVDYRYNIRGWLKQINDPTVLGDDLFSFGIRYNTTDLAGSTSLFNGNISETHWRTANDNVDRNYKYKYDALNRLLDADYSGGVLNFPENISAPYNQDENYSLKGVVYDKNGNIQHMERYGIHSAYAGVGGNHTTDIVDGLNYIYEENSNRLLNVADFADNGYSGNPYSDLDLGGFLEKYEDGNKYDYDDNGNLVKDNNKSIPLILYNHLNLPTDIYVSGSTSGVIHYTYDASGGKLSKQVNYSNGTIKTTKYAGNFIYEQLGNVEQLKFFNHAEGYVEPDGSGNFDYIYQYKDHLGNIRLSYKDVSTTSTPIIEIVEENNYYPFGLKHKGYNSNINGVDHHYGFGGMEEQNEFGNTLQWLDFGARNYDPALGRWMNIDPLAEVTYSHNPFHFAFNNPIYFIDPDGLSATGANHITGYYDDGAGNIVYDPNVNSQKELDALGIDGAFYKGDVYYDRRTGTYYDEKGYSHENMEFDWGNMKYEWSFSRWWANLNLEGNSVETIGSGFVILGSGQTTRSNNRSENPEDDIYIPEGVINALYSFSKTGKDGKKGDGRTNVTTNKKNNASVANKYVKQSKKGMSHAKKLEKFGPTLGSLSVSNTDTVTFRIQYWKNGKHHGSTSTDPVGNKSANEAVRDGMVSYPELDSVQKIRKNK